MQCNETRRGLCRLACDINTAKSMRLQVVGHADGIQVQEMRA
jgi:hypothetical protein